MHPRSLGVLLAQSPPGIVCTLRARLTEQTLLGALLMAGAEGKSGGLKHMLVPTASAWEVTAFTALSLSDQARVQQGREV